MSKEYVAIIDIGSNAVRLVVYDGLNRTPFRIHSERSVCNLGADIATTGRLNPESVKKAHDTIRRFSGLLKAMKIENVRAVATAAMRDAEDGKEFIETVQKDFGLSIMIIEGEEEARLAALGVLANGMGSDGVIGDYGGGSLELIAVEDHQVKHKVSLPLGSHRLIAEANREEQIKTIQKHLDGVGFLKDYKDKNFYAMGGAWRSMAMAHIHMSQHPIRLLDHYRMEGKKAVDFAELISRQSPSSLEKTAGVSKKRIKDMSVAALAMKVLFERIHPVQLVFSGTGLREGLLFDQLSPAVQKHDALIASCAKIALKISRFDDLKAFKILYEWMLPLFEGRDAAFLRLLEASCLLSDTGWFEHEDYQAAHAFQRVLVLPFYGIDHPGRAFLALSQYVRYKGYHAWNDVTRPAQQLLDGKMVELAATAGLAQHMGYLLTGGALSLLRQTELSVTPKQVVLSLKDNSGMLNADIVRDALQDLAKIMGREAVVKG